MDADYQNERADLEQQYIETLADLDQAITDAQLAGDAEAAQQMASYKSSVQSQYASYLMQKDAQAASFAQWQREQAAQRAGQPLRRQLLFRLRLVLLRRLRQRQPDALAGGGDAEEPRRDTGRRVGVGVQRGGGRYDG